MPMIQQGSGVSRKSMASDSADLSSLMFSPPMTARMQSTDMSISHRKSKPFLASSVYTQE